MWPLLMIWLIVCLLLIKNYLSAKYTYWSRRGIPVPPYKYIFGNLWDSITLKKCMGEFSADVYKNYEGYNYVGYYKLLKPGVILRNPELVKNVMVKDFHYFQDNDYKIDEKDDIILARNPFIVQAPEWKTARSHVSPNYSSSKVKCTMPLLQQNCKKMYKYLLERCENVERYEVNAKDLAGLITVENVASFGFGVEAGVFTDPNAEFTQMTTRLNTPSFINALKNLFVFIIPSLSKIFKIYFFDEVITQFFRKIISDQLAYRKSNNINRNDLLQSLEKLKNRINDPNVFREDDLTVHLGGFFLDGFETSSTALSYAFYEVAAHPEVQTKIREEFDRVLKRFNGELTYEAIQEMQYLECVFKESLRKHPPMPVLMKRCTQSYKLPNLYENETGPTPLIAPGTSIVVPVYGLHHDPKLFHNPHIFDPTRFSEENKDSIIKGSYLPFGEGPRNCVGSKFGILQSKVALATIILDFDLRISSKTIKPLRMDPRSFFMASVGGIWLDITKRKYKE